MSMFIADDPQQWIIDLSAEPVNQTVAEEAFSWPAYVSRSEMDAAVRAAEALATDNAKMIWGAAVVQRFPFVRQHNAISKMVVDLLGQPPGPGHALVRFLAETLDMELPDTWRVSHQD